MLKQDRECSHLLPVDHFNLREKAKAASLRFRKVTGGTPGAGDGEAQGPRCQLSHM